MAQVLVVLEVKIAVAPFGVETTCLSCTGKTSEVVGNCLEEPGRFTFFVCLNDLAILSAVLHVIPHYHGKC